jgi:hypothetical protein
MVNAVPHIFRRRIFANLFPLLGQISRFRNPFKYTRGFNLNHETVHFLRARRLLRCVLFL